MFTRIYQIDNVNDLRQYINITLCEYYQLQNGAFQMTEQVLIRSGKPCGIYFCLQGPRAVRFSAIWETDRNQILFYGPQGERFLKTQLLEAPVLESAAA
ncbi:MAG: hypothetical protein ABSA16_10410 [Thermoguttaceae bacterium]|jgi:hypothetical protein